MAWSSNGFMLLNYKFLFFFLIFILAMESYIQSCINVPTKKHIDLTNLNKETLKNMNVKELKEILQTKHIDYSGAIEKQDLIQLIEKHILS